MSKTTHDRSSSSWQSAPAIAVAVPVESPFKRGFDFVMAAFLLVSSLPLFGFAVLCWACGGGRLIESSEQVGRHGRVFARYRFGLHRGPFAYFIRDGATRQLPVLINILLGDMAFVGPRSRAPQELEHDHPHLATRSSIRPGLVCLWWIRAHANNAFEHEYELDAAYAHDPGLKSDVGILARALVAIFLGGSATPSQPEVRILGHRIDNWTMEQAIDDLIEAREPLRVCFLNADCANIAHKHPAYRNVLHTSERVFADGIGLRLAGRMLDREIRENVNGTDLFPRLCQAIEGRDRGLYLLGGRPGVADGVADWIREHHPGVSIAGVRHGYFEDEELEQVLAEIRASKAEFLLVAMGAPAQELWIARHFADTGAQVAIGVGGLFDFYSGRIQRAPQWMRDIGMEWFYRFLQEPGRMWKRYFVGNFVFLWRVLRERVRGAPPAGKAFLS